MFMSEPCQQDSGSTRHALPSEGPTDRQSEHMSSFLLPRKQKKRLMLPRQERTQILSTGEAGNS